MKLHYFNPGHEVAVFNGSPFYVAPANVRLMQRELAFLPAWYAQDDDFILVGNDFDFDFFKTFQKKFPYLPQPISFYDNYILNINKEKTKFDDLEASYWGISPTAVNFFEKIKVENAINLRIDKWRSDFCELCSRKTANNCLIFLKNKIPQMKVDVPQFVNSMEIFENVIQNSNGILIAKLPFSSSGRGILRIDTDSFSRSIRQIIQGWLRRQGCITIEAMYDKILDFAMEFRCEAGENIDFIGYSLFQTDNKLSYRANILDSQKNIENRICQFIDSKFIDKIKIEISIFFKEKYKNYTGFLGVDMLIYKSENQYFVYPCVEINMRANMGIIAVNFAKQYLFSGKSGRLSIDFCKNSGEVFANHLKMMKTSPPHFADGKLFEGYLPLCPVNSNSKYWAYVIAD